MRRYESIFIASPILTDEQVDELVRYFEGIVAEQGGELLKVEKWGRKKLAYEVQKFSEGYYVLFDLKASITLISELERRFRNHESVIKYLSIRIDKQVRALERQKAYHEHKGRRGRKIEAKKGRSLDGDV